MNERTGNIETHIGNMNNRIDNMESRMGSMEGHISSLENGRDILARQVNALTEDVQVIRQSQVRMESELTDKIRALFDAREVQNDVNERIISALNRIENKLDNQSWEVKLTTIK